MRVTEHSILNDIPNGRLVTFDDDRMRIEGYDGWPIAMALKSNGIELHRYTTNLHKPRGMYCSIGRCTDCVMVVDGVPNVRTCMTALKEGMKVQTQYGVSTKKEEDE